MSIREHIEQASALLSEGREDEAVEAASLAVREAEKGAERKLLPEALMIQGAALARRGEQRLARVTLERAAGMAARVRDFERAGLALLTLMEELQAELHADEMRELYHRADRLLSDSQQVSTLGRLRACARRVFEAYSGREPLPAENRVVDGAPRVSHDWEGCSLDEEVSSYEKGLIRLALETARGKVTEAAQLLGITHQALSFILSTRHKDLLEDGRRPRRPRRAAARSAQTGRAREE